MEEYRFQVTLNWKRTEHWFTLNVALSGAAIALLRIAKSGGTFFLVGMVFLAGAVACLVAIVATYVQHDYYRSTRNRMLELGERVSPGAAVVETTRGMRQRRPDGGRRTLAERLPRVTTLYSVLLAILLALDVVGVIYTGIETQKARHEHHPPGVTNPAQTTTTLPGGTSTP